MDNRNKDVLYDNQSEWKNNQQDNSRSAQYSNSAPYEFSPAQTGTMVREGGYAEHFQEQPLQSQFNQDSGSSTFVRASENSGGAQYQNSANNASGNRDVANARIEEKLSDLRNRNQADGFLRGQSQDQSDTFVRDSQSQPEASGLPNYSDTQAKSTTATYVKDAGDLGDDIFDKHYWEKNQKNNKETATPPVTPTDTQVTQVKSSGSLAQPFPTNASFSELVMWRDIKKSAVAFTAGLVILSALSCFSLITVFAYTSLAVIIMVGSFVFGRQLLFTFQHRIEPHPFKSQLDRNVVLNPEAVHRSLDAVLKPLNHALVRVRNLYLADSLAETLKWALYMYLLTYVGRWFNLLTLVIILWVAAFVIPPIRWIFRTQIDAGTKVVMGHVHQVQNKASAIYQDQRQKIMNKKSGANAAATGKFVSKTEIKIEKSQ